MSSREIEGRWRTQRDRANNAAAALPEGSNFKAGLGRASLPPRGVRGPLPTADRGEAPAAWPAELPRPRPPSPPEARVDPWQYLVARPAHLVLRDAAGVPLPWTAYCTTCGTQCTAGHRHGPFWKSVGPIPFDREQSPGVWWWHIGHCGNSYTITCRDCALRIAVRDALWAFENSVEEAIDDFRHRGGILYTEAREWLPPLLPYEDLVPAPTPPYPESPAPLHWPWPSRTPTTCSPSVSSLADSDDEREE